MSHAPFDTRIVEEHLRKNCAVFRSVAGAAEYAAIQDLRGYTTPSAFVIFAEEAPERGPTDTRAAPAVARIGVVIAAQNYRTGAGAGDQLTPDLLELITAVRKALIGWTPPARSATKFQWAGGAVMDYDQSTVLYADAFLVTYF